MREKECVCVYVCATSRILFSLKIYFTVRRYEEHDSFSSSFISQTTGKHSIVNIHTCSHTCEPSRSPSPGVHYSIDFFVTEFVDRRCRWGERSIRGNLDNDVLPFFVAAPRRETVKDRGARRDQTGNKKVYILFVKWSLPRKRERSITLWRIMSWYLTSSRGLVELHKRNRMYVRTEEQ